MGKMQRVKGHSFERAIAQAFRPVFPKACRQLEYQEGLGVDLTNTGPFRIQCKRGRKYASLSKIEEVPEVAGTIPVLITQGDRKETLVALRLLDFLEILKDPNYARRVVTQESSDNPGDGHQDGGLQGRSPQEGRAG